MRRACGSLVNIVLLEQRVSELKAELNFVKAEVVRAKSSQEKRPVIERGHWTRERWYEAPR